METSRLTQCPRCSAAVGFQNVVGTTVIDNDWLTIGLICSVCHLGSHFKVERDRWERLTGKAQKVSTGASSEGDGSPDPRQIGRIVKGFREVELSPSLSVGDMEAIWDYQWKLDPESIPQELS